MLMFAADLQSSSQAAEQLRLGYKHGCTHRYVMRIGACSTQRQCLLRCCLREEV